MLNPSLENMEVGIGLAARRMRQRFLGTFETVYYLQPLEKGFLWRSYPHTWQVWAEEQCIKEFSRKPSGEDLKRIFAPSKSLSFWEQVQSVLNALNR